MVMVMYEFIQYMFCLLLLHNVVDCLYVFCCCCCIFPTTFEAHCLESGRRCLKMWATRQLPFNAHIIFFTTMVMNMMSIAIHPMRVALGPKGHAYMLRVQLALQGLLLANGIPTIGLGKTLWH